MTDNGCNCGHVLSRPTRQKPSNKAPSFPIRRRWKTSSWSFPSKASRLPPIAPSHSMRKGGEQLCWVPVMEALFDEEEKKRRETEGRGKELKYFVEVRSPQWQLGSTYSHCYIRSL